jgi:hypothetical protein
LHVEFVCKVFRRYVDTNSENPRQDKGNRSPDKEIDKDKLCVRKPTIQLFMVEILHFFAFWRLLIGISETCIKLHHGPLDDPLVAEVKSVGDFAQKLYWWRSKEPLESRGNQGKGENGYSGDVNANPVWDVLVERDHIKQGAWIVIP